MHLLPPLPFQPGDRHVEAREVVAKYIMHSRGVAHVRFVNRIAVYEYFLVDQANAIAGDPDHAFHKVLCRIHRILEYDNVSTADVFVRKKMIPKAAAAVAELVYQKV